MTIAVRFSSDAFKQLGIHWDAVSWTQKQLKDINEDFSSPDIDNLLELANALGCGESDEILTTYTNQNDNQIYFSVPRVHLNQDGDLSVFVGSNLNYPLTYDNKTYKSESGLSFKVAPYKREGEKEVRAINFITTLEIDIDGLTEDFVFNLQVKAKKDIDLTELAKDLQAGKEVDSERLIQIGAGGSFSTAVKPWMVPKGLYAITRMKQPFVLPEGGKIWEGFISPVIDGEIDTTFSYCVAMNSNPFVANKSYVLVNAALKGTPVYVSIDGAYMTSMGVATIGYASILTNASQERINKFLQQAKQHQVNIRRNNQATILSDDDIARLSEEWEQKQAEKRSAKAEAKNNVVPAPAKKLESVSPSNQEEFEDIPF